MRNVAGKVAVITGGASGIGRGMAETFIAAGMKVVLTDIERKALETTVQLLRDSGGDVHGVVTDVSNAEQMNELARETMAIYGGVHVLCNNAGVNVDSHPSWNSTLDDWHWILGVNLMGVVHGIHAFLPIMLRQDCEAHIVNTSSLAAIIGSESTLYATTKAAVVALSEGLYLELKRRKQKVTVSLLCPAYVQSKILDSKRNRPSLWPNAGPAPTGPMVNVALNWAKKQIETGLSPRDVGAQVLSAIMDEHFYILTHPDWMPLVEQRMQRILAHANPKPLVRPGDELLKSMIDDAMRAGDS